MHLTAIIASYLTSNESIVQKYPAATIIPRLMILAIFPTEKMKPKIVLKKEKRRV